MFKDSNRRERLSIAKTVKEARSFAKKAGYPVLLVPFGYSTQEQDSVRALGEEELCSSFKKVRDNAFWGLVHILPSRGRYD